jgi:hypothetical protein
MPEFEGAFTGIPPVDLTGGHHVLLRLHYILDFVELETPRRERLRVANATQVPEIKYDASRDAVLPIPLNGRHTSSIWGTL